MYVDPLKRSCARANSLMQIKDVTEEDAKLIRFIWVEAKNKEQVFLRMPDKLKTAYHERTKDHSGAFRKEAIDLLIGTAGIERHEGKLRTFYYCNAGDIYAPTVIFIGQALRVGCFADFEKGSP